jgi:hypothetical protein
MNLSHQSSSPKWLPHLRLSSASRCPATADQIFCFDGGLSLWFSRDSGGAKSALTNIASDLKPAFRFRRDAANIHCIAKKHHASRSTYGKSELGAKDINPGDVDNLPHLSSKLVAPSFAKPSRVSSGRRGA